MEVNFNVLRKEIIADYNALIKKLNEAICTDIDMDRVIIPVDDLKGLLETLRSDIGILGVMYDPKIRDCDCILQNLSEIQKFPSQS